LFTVRKQTWFWLWTGWTGNMSNRTETCLSCSTFRNHAFSLIKQSSNTLIFWNKLKQEKPVKWSMIFCSGCYSDVWPTNGINTRSLCPRPRDLSGVCSWTSCWLVSSSVQWVPPGLSSRVVMGKGCVSTTGAERSSTSPWSNRTSLRRPRWSAAAGTCVWRGTCRQRPADDLAPSLPRRSVPATTASNAVTKISKVEW